MKSEQLKDYDFGLAIDKSTSMGDKEPISGLSRWNAAREGTIGIARKMAEYDSNGIDVYMFASGVKTFRNVSATAVENLFKENEPNGGTNLHLAIREAGQQYFRLKAEGKAKKGYILGVITDGEPNDKQAVIDEIVAISKRIDRDEEFGIQLVQVGNDPLATAYLKTLDDDLVAKHGAKFDIVDTVTYVEAESRPIADLLISSLTD